MSADQPSAAVEAGAYWPRPWSGEDGGPRRLCRPEGQPGLGIEPGERLKLDVFRDSFAADMLIRREEGELYALRHDMPKGDPLAGDCEGWVEKLDPKTLMPLTVTPRFPAGRYWPGGIAAHANGDIYMVFGRWARRFSKDLELKAERKLPVDRPYNSFVILDTGELVTKDCDAPRGEASSTFSVLDPETLESVVPELEIEEGSIARLASDGRSVICVGTESVLRLNLDREAEELVVDEEWRPHYGRPGQSFGWDPVIADEHVFWMDNGKNSVDWTMRGSGDEPSAVRLWWCRLDDADSLRSVEISGLPHGTESNPPAWDPERGVVVAYDAGNAVVRAWRLVGDDLEPLWRRDDLAHAGHLILHPDTRELVVQDYRDIGALRKPALRRAIRGGVQRLGRYRPIRRYSPIGRDSLVVLDLDTGEEKGRVVVPSPSQAFLFPAPGFDRDVYYLSMTSMARITVE
ncbi:MAG: hypothetical protein J0H98_06330 [Solirubrobacterales bacterium]|nr:hypothetical protein [Solirubrobacterales bacterium]